MKMFEKSMLVTLFMTTILPVVVSQVKIVESESFDVKTVESMVAQISTAVDTAFIYDYDRTKFVPPKGKTLLIMGQTVERINEYMNRFPNQQTPGGWSAYWGIPEFKGVKESHKTSTGDTQNHQMLVDKFPNTAIHSAMWMVGKWDVDKKTARGDYDDVIKKYGKWAKSTNRPIYLRIGYEFDGPHNTLEPQTYVEAYKRVVDGLRKQGVSNIAFVWHSYASKPYKDYKLSAWYPGDDYVDWVGISVFGHAYNGLDFGPYCDDVLQFAKQHKKPVMIAESNPVKGIERDNMDVWNQCFVNFFTFTYNKNIKAISFINEDWKSLTIEGTNNWKDGRLYNNKEVSKAWFRETDKNRYLKQSPELFEQLGFKK